MNLTDLYAPLGPIAARAEDDLWLTYFAAGKLQARVKRPISVLGQVAVIPLQGAIFRGGGQYGTDPDHFRQAVQAAAASPKIKQILIHVDSPGGGIPGVALAADAVYQARQSKPITAITADFNCSAALWITSQASRVVSTRDGWTGSHGVFRQHMSWAEAAKKMGVECTFIFAGKYKVEGNMWQPLSADSKEYWQAHVNNTFGEFTEALARGRNKTTAHVLEHFGQGRALTARQALAAGMIDEIIEADQIVSQLQQTSGVVAVNAELTAELLCAISGDLPAEKSGVRRHSYLEKRLRLRERVMNL